VIALLTGALLVLVHPGWSFRLFAPFALIPLFFTVLTEQRAKQRFLWGYLTGVVYWCGVCYWIQATLQEHGGMAVAESWCLFILFCLAKAIQTGVFAWLAPFAARDWWAAPALAALWTVFEWTHNYTGFAWLVLGNAAIDWPLGAKLAPYAGVWGLSFAIALLAAIVVTRQCRWLALFGVLIFVPALSVPSPANLTVRAVQPNLPDDAQYSPQGILALQHHLAELSAAPLPPTLTVWPEVPAPIYDRDRFLADIRQPRFSRVWSATTTAVHPSTPRSSSQKMAAS